MVCSLLAYAPMGLFEEDSSSSGLIVSHVLYKAAFVIALMRWVLYWALRLRQRLLSSSSSSSSFVSDHGYNFLEVEHGELQNYPPVPSSCASSSTQLIRDCLVQTTFEEITNRQGSYRASSSGCDTCAVCLSQLEMEDQVRELRNCSHVFHTECIDRWLEYHDHHHDDNHRTCPLCRTPLLTSSQIQSLSWDHRSSQPSWAVERLLYLFGDDLLL
ncbi:hypothetical protein PRUPE_7G189400 [Prunus persica]|uniref:Uncharacterized protein n=1 Tax=Prunus persica TaxID=3760 RepID=M5WAD6_PRUPE|nr:probable E3 ubiquitin-protein ligase XERICO [Prunus persica]ONH97423.1 hypothetical protein PRUPE_7G189400 [Prunus persica]